MTLRKSSSRCSQTSSASGSSPFTSDEGNPQQLLQMRRLRCPRPQQLLQQAETQRAQTAAARSPTPGLAVVAASAASAMAAGGAAALALRRFDSNAATVTAARAGKKRNSVFSTEKGLRGTPQSPLVVQATSHTKSGMTCLGSQSGSLPLLPLQLLLSFGCTATEMSKGISWPQP